ncbi:MAG TPA: hypothetical protein VNA25_18750 [Phycisphaerae bacterium]|nr:hypothetical protein [Phycisphaerae bacterium]
MTESSLTQRLEIEVDNYQQTVLALRALANEILFDENTRDIRQGGSAHCGRRFRTSPRNRHTPGTNVHPDLAVVRSASSGILAEAKLGFDSDPTLFERRIVQTAKQLEKYDDDLTGWPVRDGQGALRHDLALLVNFEDARRAVRRLCTLMQEGGLALERQFAVLSISRLARSSGEWPTLALEHGSLTDSGKTEKLDNRIPIRPEILDASPVFGQIRLCDHEPPLPLMMQLVHQALVSNLTADESEQYNLEGEVLKELSVGQLQHWLGPYAFKRSDSRDPVVPRREWIRAALSRFIDMGWASKAGSGPDRFTYHHKRGRKGCNDPLGRFVEVCARYAEQAERKKRRQEGRARERRQREREKLKKRHPLFAEQIALEDGLSP